MGWYRSEPGSGQFLAISFLWMCACVCSFYILRYLVEEHLFLYLSYETESTLIFLGTAAMGILNFYAYTSCGMKQEKDMRKRGNIGTQRQNIGMK